MKMILLCRGSTQQDLNLHHEKMMKSLLFIKLWVHERLGFYPKSVRRKNHAYLLDYYPRHTMYAIRMRNPWVTHSVIQCRNICIVAMEESVGFEPTEHFCSTVFKTVALNQTLPTFHVYRHTILVVSFDHRKIAISMSYVRIRLYSSAVEAIAYLL